MNLSDDDHVVRYAPFTKLHRDKDDNVVGVLPQAFELRLDKGETYLSVNWLEYFEGDRKSNIEALVRAFRKSRDRTGKKSAFCIGNVGEALKVCITYSFPQVRIVYEKPTNRSKNKSHSKIIRLPDNDAELLDAFADEIFNDLAFNSDISEI